MAMQLILVAIGGGMGAAFRHLTNVLARSYFSAGFPWGTMIVNVLGSLLMGVLAGWFSARAEAPQEIRLLLGTGLLGGYTTFSAFSLDLAELWRSGAFSLALLYAAGSVALSFAAIFAGFWLVRATP